MVGLAAGYAQADDGRLGKIGLVRIGLHEMAEQTAVQITKAVRRVETDAVPVVRRQQHAEIIVAQVGGEVVSDDAGDAIVRLAIDDAGVQNFDDGKRREAVGSGKAHRDGNDIQFHAIAIPIGIVPIG